MTYVRPLYIRDTPDQANELPHRLKLAIIRMLIVFYCRLRGVSEDDFYDFVFEQLKLESHCRRMINPACQKPSGNPAAITPLIPKEQRASLSANQLRELSGRLLGISRSQLYNQLYNLTPFGPKHTRSTIERSCTNDPLRASGPAPILPAYGLSPAHAWPD